MKQQVKRLNWGCGTEPEAGWLNSDIKEGAGIDISCDILEGLPLDDDSIDYAVSIHALPELRQPDLVPALEELRRVLKPEGVLRLALPNLETAIAAYQAGDADYFLVPDEDARSLGGKMIVQLTWYGYSKSMFLPDWTQELLERASFRNVQQCGYRQTASDFPEIVDLDNRERESIFFEGVK